MYCKAHTSGVRTRISYVEVGVETETCARTPPQTVSYQQQLAGRTAAEDKLLSKGTGRGHTSGVRTRM